MLFAAADITETIVLGGVIGVVVSVIMRVLLGGGPAAASQTINSGDRELLRKLNAKVDLLLNHWNIDPAMTSEQQVNPATDELWQQIAADPGRKIEAIKLYREVMGVGLAEAKHAVEDYIASLSR